MTALKDELLAEIAALADELCNPIRTVERLEDRDRHRNIRGRRGRAPARVWAATFPSLLGQLAIAKYPGDTYAVADEENDRHGAAPAHERSPARLEAVARLLAIETAAAVWCQRAGRPLRDDVVANVRALVGAAGAMHSDDLWELARDVGTWRTWAAVASGWETPPEAPRVACPACGVRNSIRVRILARQGFCAACGAAWSPETIGILGEHIRLTQAVRPDTAPLRAAAVAVRREWEARRLALAGRERPDLPYVAC